jgi:antitoxin component of RelBE/YafQ-DinJ toxin-antitoxin module
MPSPSKSQLNLSVDTDLKNQFKSLCDREEISLAKAFEIFMAESVSSQKVLDSPSKSPSASTIISPSIERLEITIKELEDRLLGK